MAHPIITEIQLWEADLSAEITVDAPDIWTQAVRVQRTERLWEPEKCQIVLIPGSDLFQRNPLILTERRILKLAYDDGTYRVFRITHIDQKTGSDTSSTIFGTALWFDLAYLVPRIFLGSGYGDLSITQVGTAEDFLTSLLSSTYGLPAYFDNTETYPAHADESGQHLRIEYFGHPFLFIIRDICEQVMSKGTVGMEPEFVWDEGNDRYDISFYTEVGGGVGEASQRPILGPGGGDTNRLRTSRIQDTRDFYNRLIPIGGDINEPLTIGQATFLVAGYSGQWVYFDELDVVAEADQFIGLYFGNETDGFFAITDSDPEHTVVATDYNALELTGSISVLDGTRSRFAINSDGDELLYLPKAGAGDYGTSEQVHEVSGIQPYPNVLQALGNNVNTDGGSSGAGAAGSWLPTGWAKVGSPTTDDNTDTQYYRYSQQSVKIVTTAIGEGIECEFTFPVDTEEPYLSYWITLYIAAGGARVELEDSDGVVFPSGSDALISEKVGLQGWEVEGIDPVQGTLTIRVLGTTGADEIYWDALTVTRSPTAWPWSEYMGPTALFRLAQRKVVTDGGVLPPIIEGDVLDVTSIDGDVGHLEIEIGSYVRYQDVFDDETPLIDVDARVKELTVTETRDGRRRKSIRLSRTRRSFFDRFKDKRKRDLPVRDLRDIQDEEPLFYHEAHEFFAGTKRKIRLRIYLLKDDDDRSAVGPLSADMWLVFGRALHDEDAQFSLPSHGDHDTPSEYVATATSPVPTGAVFWGLNTDQGFDFPDDGITWRMVVYDNDGNVLWEYAETNVMPRLFQNGGDGGFVPPPIDPIKGIQWGTNFIDPCDSDPVDDPSPTWPQNALIYSGMNVAEDNDSFVMWDIDPITGAVSNKQDLMGVQTDPGFTLHVDPRGNTPLDGPRGLGRFFYKESDTRMSSCLFDGTDERLEFGTFNSIGLADPSYGGVMIGNKFYWPIESGGGELRVFNMDTQTYVDYTYVGFTGKMYGGGFDGTYLFFNQNSRIVRIPIYDPTLIQEVVVLPVGSKALMLDKAGGNFYTWENTVIVRRDYPSGANPTTIATAGNFGGRVLQMALHEASQKIFCIDDDGSVSPLLSVDIATGVVTVIDADVQYHNGSVAGPIIAYTMEVQV